MLFLKNLIKTEEWKDFQFALQKTKILTQLCWEIV